MPKIAQLQQSNKKGSELREDHIIHDRLERSLAIILTSQGESGDDNAMIVVFHIVHERLEQFLAIILTPQGESGDDDAVIVVFRINFGGVIEPDNSLQIFSVKSLSKTPWKLQDAACGQSMMRTTNSRAACP